MIGYFTVEENNNDEYANRDHNDINLSYLKCYVCGHESECLSCPDQHPFHRHVMPCQKQGFIGCVVVHPTSSEPSMSHSLW